MVDESRRLIQAQRQLAAQGREPQTRAPGFSQYLVMLDGNLALLEGRPHDAVVQFQRFLDNHGSRQRGSRDQRVKRLLADALAATGDLGGAVAVLESASDRPLATMGWPLNGQAEWLARSANGSRRCIGAWGVTWKPQPWRTNSGRCLPWPTRLAPDQAAPHCRDHRHALSRVQVRQESRVSPSEARCLTHNGPAGQEEGRCVHRRFSRWRSWRG